MTPETIAEAQAALSEPVLSLEAAGEMVNIEAGETPQGPGPGDETVMSWARAM